MTTAEPNASRLIGGLMVTQDGRAVGHAFVSGRATGPLVVEILADGASVGLVQADRFVPDLEASMAAWSGFSMVLPEPVLFGAASISAILANTGEPVGEPVALAERRPAVAAPVLAHVEWAGGLRLRGCLENQSDAGATVRALIDGEMVAEARAIGWTQRDPGSRLSSPSFDLHLPARFADSRARHVDVIGPTGDRLPGSPCFVFAVEDRLESLLDSRAELTSERMRARYAQGLLPQSWPFTEAATYLERFGPPPLSTDARGSLAAILVGEEDLEASLASLDLAGDPTLLAACLPRNGSESEFVPGDLVALLEGEARGIGTIVFARSGTVFFPKTLRALVEALPPGSDTPFSYGDYAIRQEGRLWPIGLPAFDLERWMEQGYAAHLFAMSADRALAAARRGATSLYQLVNETLDLSTAARPAPVHVPLILGELPARRERVGDRALEQATKTLLANHDRTATVSPRTATLRPAVRILRLARRSVSVVVAARNTCDVLATLLQTLSRDASGGELEVIVVDNGASPVASFDDWAAFEAIGGRRLTVPGAFQAPRARNAGAAAARGEYLFFIDDDVSPTGSWHALIEELLGRMAGLGVGAVSPLVVWPSGLIRSAGLVLGCGLAAGPSCADRMAGEAGHGSLLDVAHEVSALSADAMMTRRDLFVARGGFDSLHFPLAHADVDYCLGLRSEGFRIVITPDARMSVASGLPQCHALPVGHEARLARDKALLQCRWGAVLMSDPFYSPWLALDGAAYSALAWPPRDRAARTNRIGQPRSFPSEL